jgi:hypothetical protein
MEQRRSTPLHYQIFLFCLWEEPANAPAGCSVWRFSLENPHTGQRIGFQNLAALMHYLQQQTAFAPPQPSRGEGVVGWTEEGSSAIPATVSPHRGGFAVSSAERLGGGSRFASRQPVETGG